jgi:hypothetical protein
VVFFGSIYSWQRDGGSMRESEGYRGLWLALLWEFAWSEYHEEILNPPNNQQALFVVELGEDIMIGTIILFS